MSVYGYVSLLKPTYTRFYFPCTSSLRVLESVVQVLVQRLRQHALIAMLLFRASCSTCCLNECCTVPCLQACFPGTRRAHQLPFPTVTRQPMQIHHVPCVNNEARRPCCASTGPRPCRTLDHPRATSDLVPPLQLALDAAEVTI
jgi:hypothetical protein